MTQHTTGKWEYALQDSNMYSVHGSRSTPVAMINPFNRDWMPNDEVEANAKLIAQSPAMLVFIKEFVSALKDKSKLTIHEKALLHSAEEILKATE